MQHSAQSQPIAAPEPSGPHWHFPLASLLGFLCWAALAWVLFK